MIRTDRRAVLTGLAAALTAPPAWARDDEYAIDWQGEPVDPRLADILARQIAAIRALPIKPSALAFFARQPILIARRTGIGSRVIPRGALITRDPFPVDNPVLLHELLHRYHTQMLPEGRRNPDLLRFFADAKAKKDWPQQAYLYTDVGEFFAMTASVVLSGKAARPPYARAEVERRMPALYRWIVTEFALRI